MQLHLLQRKLDQPAYHDHKVKQIPTIFNVGFFALAEAKCKDFEHGFKGKNEPKNSPNVMESAVIVRLFGSSTIIMDI